MKQIFSTCCMPQKLKILIKYEKNGCSNAGCDKETKVAEVERLDLKDNNLQDEAQVELGKIYKKLKESLGKKDKEANKAFIKFSNGSNCLYRNQLVSCLCCNSGKVTRRSENIGFQLQVIQYAFQIKILCEETPNFQRRDWL